ncbi:unnamed protein product [Clavelina lepadiformis]|uniref:BRCT domain-containing protein n=1 Tax=Clavelina lepadiformis TaxID=159417 RepID=A0ABP0FJ53_CLALP
MSADNEVRLLSLSEEGKENLEAVCKLLNDGKIKTIWISPEEALSVQRFKDDVIYVIDPTEGAEVEHLVSLGFTVIGPQCAVTVLKHDIQLKKNLKYPVHNLTMFNCLICFSNIPPKERQEMMSKVEKMGGKTSGLLTQDVTHLIVSEVGSVKYFSAAHVGIPVMTSDWIAHLWKKGSSRYICAKDGKWEEFKCPIFRGCSVCVTGLSTNERNKIQKLVTKFGGTYSGAMKLDFTTHLVVHKPEGQKYAMASKFGVKVVNVDWVYKSVEKGSCQDHSKFPVKVPTTSEEALPHSSTPEKHAARIPNIQDMSNISVLTVNETMGTSMVDVSRLSSISAAPTSVKTDKSDLIQFSFDRLYEQVLDGVCVFVVGFAKKEEEKLKQVLSISGATRYNQLTSSVTHVIVGSVSLVPDPTLNLIRTNFDKSGRELWVVNYKWLLDSLNTGEMVSEIKYLVDGFVPEHCREHVDDDASKRANFSNEKKKFPENIVPDPSDFTMNILSQYMDNDSTMQNTTSNDTTVKDVTVYSKKSNADNNNVTIATEKASDESDVVWSLFVAKTFHILGFDDEDHERCVENIQSLKGEVMSSGSCRKADYAVVPITGYAQNNLALEVVTDFWVDLCIHNGCLVEPSSHPMCTPFEMSDEILPFDGCVGCISQYQEPERGHLINLIQQLGGLYQDNVVRKDMLRESMHRTTHLIVINPEGDKYMGCRRWGIFTVSADWVYECARQRKRVDEIVFDVVKLDETKDCALVSVATKPSTNEGNTENVDSTMLEFLPMPRGPSKVDSIKRRLDARLEAKRAKMQKQETPMQERFRRLNMETPSKFFGKGANVNVSFQLDEVFDMLKTPAHDREKVREAIKSNPDTPLSEFVERFLAQTLKQQPSLSQVIANLEGAFDKAHDDDDQINKENVDSNNKMDVEETVNPAVGEILPDQDDTKPLTGTVVFACKKLNKRRMALSSMVTELGGEFRWTYDSLCTHVLFQGKHNDTNKEFRTARSDGKIIVSPHWVVACDEVDARVDEQDYPHVYDPNKSMQIVHNKTSRVNISKVEAGQNKSSNLSQSTQLGDATSQAADVEKEGASQEARDSLKKTLENIMSSTTRLKKDSSISSNGRFSSPAHLTHRLSPPSDSTDKSENKTNAEMKPESSQDVHVVWDDPIGRKEMERLRKVEDEKDDGNSMQEERDHRGQIVRERGKPSFLVSSVTPEQKLEYAEIIQSLGGVYLDSDCFNASCTHLIVRKPARNEKFLASLSSGRWVVHTSYIEACRDAGEFLREDPYEYGNPASSWQPGSETEALLMASAHRWRCNLQERNGKGAFSDWNILLHVSDRQCPGFVRLLQSGSGHIIAKSLPYTHTLEGVTHAIIDPGKAKQLPRSEISRLVEAGVHCCVPEYIADFLMKEPQPSAESFYLPVVKSMLQS